jgi:uncharacterized protein YuzE
MKLTFDPKHNIAYIRFHEKTAKVDTIRVSDELNVDMAPDGTIYGIELLNANAQLQPEKNGKLVAFDEGSGQNSSLATAVHERKATYRTTRKKVMK